MVVFDQGELKTITPEEIMNIHKSADHITCNRLDGKKPVICLWYNEEPIIDNEKSVWYFSGEAKFEGVKILDLGNIEVKWGQRRNWTKRKLSRVEVCGEQ